MRNFGEDPWVDHQSTVGPRVLLLTSQLPGPAASGPRRRGLELIKRLSERFDVHLLVVSEKAAEDQAEAAALQPYCREIEILPTEPRRRVHDALELAEPGLLARHHSEQATGRVGEILAAGAVDLVHVDGFYLMQHIPEWVDVPVLLTEQHVEYDLERQQVSTFGGPVQDLDAFGECVLTHDTELECWSRASCIGAVTAEDRDLILSACPAADVRLIADGADHVLNVRALGSIRVAERPRGPLLTLPADLSCQADMDAALHFCEDILPLIRERLPDVHLWLVGDAPSPAIRALASDTIRVTGKVADVVPYLDAADVVVCPFRVDGAVRASASEALRRGKASVCTSVGARGLPGPVREALIIADDSDSFAAAVTSLLLDASRRAELEDAANHAAMLLPRWEEAASALGGVYDELLREASAAAGHAAQRLTAKAGARS